MKRSSGVLNQKPPTFPDFKDLFDSGCASAYVVTFLFFYGGCAEGISWSKGVKECLFKKEKSTYKGDCVVKASTSKKLPSGLEQLVSPVESRERARMCGAV